MDSITQQIQEAAPPGFQTTLQRAKSNSKSFQQPTPRIFHSCVCLKAFIYIYGGLSLNPTQQFTNEHMFVYRYQIHRFEWKKIQTNFPNNLGTLNPLQNIYSHSCVVHGNFMYLFGGKSGRNGQCTNELWGMNLQSFNWRKQDQKGIVPAKRQSASLVLANKSNLFLYGGKNEDFIFNDIHIYKIESKQWYNVETNVSELLISKRLRPGICAVNDIIYLFGGERESSVEEKTEILDDFYQVTFSVKKIKIVQKATSVKPDVWIKKISTLLKPGELVGARLFSINDRHVGLLGGNISAEIESKNKLWMYDPHKIKWIYSNIEDTHKYNLGLGFNATFQYDRVYISGGLKSDFKPLGSLYSIYIDSSEVPVNQVQSQQKQRLCLLCHEQKNSLCKKKMDGFGMFEQSLKQMQFPFNAFGLLVDNSNLIKSTQISISCCSAGKEKYLVIEDDGNCENIWTGEDEFIEDMMKFRTISEQEMEVEGDESLESQIENIDQGNMEVEEEQKEKKRLEGGKEEAILGSAKKEEDKEEQRKLKKKKELAKRNKARKIRRRKQFSVNIKLGGMRLAKKMLYISQNSDGSRRVFFLQELKILSLEEESLSDNKYQCHYYLLPAASALGPVHSHYSSEASRQFLQSQYNQYLKPAMDSEESVTRNRLILIGLRQTFTEDNLRQPQLKINPKLNDIYYGSSKLIAKAESLNILVNDCVDISLKCYLSMLYLKGEYAKITIATQHDKAEEVTNSLYFDRVDNLVKSTTIMDLEAAFDLEQCKIVQLYYHKNLLQTGKKFAKNDKTQRGSAKELPHSNNLNAFLNGILIYHRNRLIKRYEYPLGSLLKYSQLKKTSTKNYNPLKIFGFIEMDEVFYSNILKTKFVNQENLCNMYARIKFVEEYLEGKSHELPQLGGKRSHKKEESEQTDNRKKVKLNQ